MTAVQTKTESTITAGLAFTGKQNRQYYFAYGSNMNKEQILARCTTPVTIAVARLPDHRIGFYGYSKTWDGAVETLVPAPGRELWGVLYELHFLDLDRLDGWQDVRLDGSGAYFHYPVRVIDTEGTTHTALLYKKDILGAPQPPSREYLDYIIQGAGERGLPSDYREALRRMDAKKATFGVPRRGNYRGDLPMGTSCSGCETTPV
ncbi:MAG: gamma-glutamylcyclotransferase family protein [Solidesulfovibrio sp.]